MVSIDNVLKSQVALGTAGFSGQDGGYGFGEFEENEIKKILELSYEKNISVIDTAPIYGFGAAESRLGLNLGSFRDQFFIISKGGVSWHSTKRVNMTNCPKELEKMFYASLKRLKTDYLDGYLIHWPDEKFDIRYSYEVLAKLKDKGLVRYIGLSNTNDRDYQLAREISPIDILQGEFNLFNDQSFEKS